MHSQSMADAQDTGREGLRMAARAGFAARGVVYGIVGVLAFMAAFTGGGGKAPHDQRHGPSGKPSVGAAVGLDEPSA